MCAPVLRPKGFRPSGGGRSDSFFPLPIREHATPLLAEAATNYSLFAHCTLPRADARKRLVMMPVDVRLLMIRL